MTVQQLIDELNTLPEDQRASLEVVINNSVTQYVTTITAMRIDAVAFNNADWCILFSKAKKRLPLNRAAKVFCITTNPQAHPIWEDDESPAMSILPVDTTSPIT